jgi:ribosomal protein S16
MNILTARNSEMIASIGGSNPMVKLFKNRETMETTADYGKALDWRKDGDRVSEYQKVGEL